MKLPILLFIILFSAHSFARQVPVNQATKPKQALESDYNDDLRLTITLVSSRLIGDDTYITLDLTYKNAGKRPIILDSISKYIGQILVSKRARLTGKRKYFFDQRSEVFTEDGFKAIGITHDRTPDKTRFVTLKPGETFVARSNELYIFVSHGAKRTKDSLNPGDFSLQVIVQTWYYLFDAPPIVREWQKEGYLWSQSILSEPMPFTVERER